MSDEIHHHCGLALVRLRQPLSYYRRTYGSVSWGLDKLHLLMIKQRNRGQDGAGVAVVKFDPPMGHQYIQRRRSDANDPVETVFGDLHRKMRHLHRAGNENLSDEQLKRRFAFLGELYLGHLRYGTHGEDGQAACHPYVRKSNWATRNLVLAGNYNMTNADEIFDKLVGYGLHPVGVSDTLTLLEKIGHFLDEENHRVYRCLRENEPDLQGQALARRIGLSIDLTDVLRQASPDWDGGYTLVGLVGHGDAFVCRDPNGIRPAFYYVSDDVAAMASERVALTTVFNVPASDIQTVEPGHVLLIPREGEIRQEQFTTPGPLTQCTFERIYFSRGNDPDIYAERKRLGKNLAPTTLDAIDHDLEHTVFSFIPNTAETAFLGLIAGIESIVRDRHAQEIWELHRDGTLTREDVARLVNGQPRIEKATHKDQKVRTFITQDRARHDLVSHVYDITRGSVEPGDTLVVMDDSIVRGTTLRDSIVTMLTRLNPRRIIVLSSAPPICYPDCYGIDMSELGRFVAFQAAVAIVRERGDAQLLDDVYEACRAQADRPARQIENHVRRIYDGIEPEDLSRQVARTVRSPDVRWDGELRVIYQTIDGLRQAMPAHTGDWYFTGDYPTPGGFKVLNTAYINFHENKTGRSY